VYRCPCCGELSITLGQKAWVCYRGRPTVCRRCGGAVGISTTVFYLTQAPGLLYVLGLFLYTLSGAQIRTRLTFWLLVISILVVPMIYNVLATAIWVWFVPLLRR
jgi:hypothetical protein